MASTPLSREERLKEYFQRLGSQPASQTAEEALERIIQTLDEVEDEYSGIPKRDPPPHIPDGRMYPPLDDRIARRVDGRICAGTKGHQIVIDPDGSITISNRATGVMEFQQAGGGR